MVLPRAPAEVRACPVQTLKVFDLIKQYTKIGRESRDRIEVSFFKTDLGWEPQLSDSHP